MQLINIVPVKNMGFIAHQPMSMFLTHLVEKYPEYRQAAKEYAGYKILDNSLIELGKATSLQRVVTCARAIRADEIILPDVFCDGRGTIESVLKSLEELKTLDPHHIFKYMAVCQGKDAIEFAATYYALEMMPDIDVIGIPKVCAKMLPDGRPGFEYLWNTREKHKSIHLLGMWYSFEEYDRYLDTDGIRSVDSCLAAYFAYNGLSATSVRPDGFTIDLENANISYRGYVECQPYWA